MKITGLILVLIFSISVYGNTIVVGKDKSINSISKGIDLARVGDTVKVYPGIYREGRITITKSITLIGVDYPVIDGQKKFENMVISGIDIKVQGFHFIDSRHSSSDDFSAISIIDATKIIVEDNKIDNAHFGIHIANSTYCTVKGNNILGQAVSEQSAGNGIHIWKSSHAFIVNNHIQGHRDGIYFEFVTESEIRNNKSENNIRYGLHFMFSHNNFYAYNTFRKNGAGVAVMYTHHVRMEHNIFESNWGTASYAILLKDITDSWIVNNQFISNTIGIFMEGCNRIDVKQNLFSKNGWAMKVQANCVDNVITQNNFKSNTFDIATNGTMVSSTFDYNYWDKYEGYDLNKDGIGDISYHPVSMYAMIIEQNPNVLILLRSFMVTLLDKAEKALPTLTPENLVDKKPKMKPFKL